MAARNKGIKQSLSLNFDSPEPTGALQMNARDFNLTEAALVASQELADSGSGGSTPERDYVGVRSFEFTTTLNLVSALQNRLWRFGTKTCSVTWRPEGNGSGRPQYAWEAIVRKVHNFPREGLQTVDLTFIQNGAVTRTLQA